MRCWRRFAIICFATGESSVEDAGEGGSVIYGGRNPSGLTGVTGCGRRDVTLFSFSSLGVSSVMTGGCAAAFGVASERAGIVAREVKWSTVGPSPSFFKSTDFTVEPDAVRSLGICDFAAGVHAGLGYMALAFDFSLRAGRVAAYLPLGCSKVSPA